MYFILFKLLSVCILSIFSQMPVSMIYGVSLGFPIAYDAPRVAPSSCVLTDLLLTRWSLGAGRRIHHPKYMYPYLTPPSQGATHFKRTNSYVCGCVSRGVFMVIWMSVKETSVSWWSRSQP